MGYVTVSVHLAPLAPRHGGRVGREPQVQAEEEEHGQHEHAATRPEVADLVGMRLRVRVSPNPNPNNNPNPNPNPNLNPNLTLTLTLLTSVSCTAARALGGTSPGEVQETSATRPHTSAPGEG